MKSAGTVFALVALAVSAYCAWRWITRRRDNRDIGPNATNASSSATASAASTPAASSTSVATSITRVTQRPQSRPTQPTVQTTLLKRLNGGRKMTIQVSDVILDSLDFNSDQRGFTVRASSIQSIKQLAAVCDIYLLVRVSSDDEERQILDILESSGLVAPGSVYKDKVLFCESDVGVPSFVKQLEPDWHVDSSLSTIRSLTRFVRNQLWVTKLPQTVDGNISVCQSIEEVFEPS